MSTLRKVSDGIHLIGDRGPIVLSWHPQKVVHASQYPYGSSQKNGSATRKARQVLRLEGVGYRVIPIFQEGVNPYYFSGNLATLTHESSRDCPEPLGCLNFTRTPKGLLYVLGLAKQHLLDSRNPNPIAYQLYMLFLPKLLDYIKEKQGVIVPNELDSTYQNPKDIWSLEALTDKRLEKDDLTRNDVIACLRPEMDLTSIKGFSSDFDKNLTKYRDYSECEILSLVR